LAAPVTPTRLSPLDASFLAVESASAHMHVGWVALFSPPKGRRRPSFIQLRDHVAGRLVRAPRYRQRLVGVPLGLHDPVWVDDEKFDVKRHVRQSRASSITTVVDRVMSTPLDRAGPLWQLWIADNLADGRIGIVGKAHHCMVDGIAAVELAALLLDPTTTPPPADPDDWRPEPAPSASTLLAHGLRDRVSDELDLVRLPARLARSPKRVLGLAGDGQRAARALAQTFSSPAPRTLLNRPISPLRHLALSKHSLGDLKQVKRRFRTTVNDVVLAASSGGVRRFLQRRGERPIRLKTMVPVNVRDGDGAGELGNRISFLFVDLPCDEPDPVRRLLDIHMAMSDRKQAGEPKGSESALRAVGYAPRRLQRLVSQLVASPRTFNLVVSNIPGPSQPLYMRGCELEEAYPVVPLADRHGVSIGVTTIKDGAFFGIYADRESLPDAELLARGIDESIEELIDRTR
jgi:diacylglycerol O-acyltransferase / wax synthase